MQKKILLSIFSYNRKIFLENLLNSIKRFYKEFDVVIFDDNSSNKSLIELYKNLPKEIKVLKNISQKKNRHGGLYSLMNEALDYSIKQDYEYVFFIQDDMQFLWRNENLLIELDQIFSKRKDILMYSPLFMQKIYKPNIKERIRLNENENEVLNMGIGDMGIIQVSRAEKNQLIFDDKGEKFNGKKYYENGFNLIISKTPILAWVPWTSFYREKKKSFQLVSYKKSKAFINDISEKNIEKLKNNSSFAFLEDYTSIQKKYIPKPYLYSEKNIITILKKYKNYFLANGK